MPVDKWGIPFFYPTKKTAGVSGTGQGFYWTQSNNIHDDDDYEGDAMVRIGKEHDDSDFKVIDSSTGTFQFPFLTDGDGLDMSGPTGHHSGGETHECQGYAYMCDANLMTNPPKFRFRKETYHVQYNDHPDGEFTHPSATGTCINQWKGFGWVAYNKKDGRSAGKDSRICECWWNNDPVADITKWVMLKRVEDKGAGVTNWGVPATCDGDDYQVGTWSNIQFRFKSSGSDFSLHPLIPEPDNGPNVESIGGVNMSFSDCERRGYGKRVDMPRDIEMKCLVKWDAGGRGKAHFKNISLREIDPSLSFVDTPTVPEPTEEPGSTSEVQGLFKFQWDVNTIRSSACAGTGVGSGGGGETGNAKFYSVYTDEGADSDKELSNTSTYQNRTRLVMQPVNGSSIFVGKTPRQLDIPLKKVGSPDINYGIRARIYSSTGGLIYWSPTDIDPSTLSTSYTKQIFDFSTNTHALVSGDRIGIEWNSPTDAGYVVASYQGTAYPNTNYYQYENGTWELKTRRLVMDVWE